MKNIWPKMASWIKKEIEPRVKEEMEKRKPMIEEEFQKEKQELKEEVPEVSKSLWEKFKELIKQIAVRVGDLAVFFIDKAF